MSPPFQLLTAIALPMAAVYSLIGGGRLVKWISEQQTRAPAPVPIERVRAGLVRLRAQLEAMETRTDLPAKNLRLRGAASAQLVQTYLDQQAERQRRTAEQLLSTPMADAVGAQLSDRARRDALAVITSSYEEHGGFRLRTLSA